MDDLISRQAAIDLLKSWSGGFDYIETETEAAIKDFQQLPPAQSERKKGRWVRGREIGREILTDGTTAVVYEDYKCSSCGLILYRLLHNNDGTSFYKFCPNCGAKMEGEEK